MVALADVPTIRDWMTFGKAPKLVCVDILEQFWYVETLRVRYRAPSDVVSEAIGKYQAHQQKLLGSGLPHRRRLARFEGVWHLCNKTSREMMLKMNF
jgi:hypothetical protein